MRVDNRGRVRFGYRGHRYELTSRGLKVYRRGLEWASWAGKAIETERAMFHSQFTTGLLVGNTAGRTLLEEALHTLRTTQEAKQFTTAIHIPKHMRATPVKNRGVTVNNFTTASNNNPEVAT